MCKASKGFHALKALFSKVFCCLTSIRISFIVLIFVKLMNLLRINMVHGMSELR
jgi:hypothetical protein